jgi:hypothetical protein
MISSKGAGFAGILQSLAGLERVSTRSAFAKMRVWAGVLGANAAAHEKADLAFKQGTLLRQFG